MIREVSVVRVGIEGGVIAIGAWEHMPGPGKDISTRMRHIIAGCMHPGILHLTHAFARAWVFAYPSVPITSINFHPRRANFDIR
jgi:hypothetical protein